MEAPTIRAKVSQLFLIEDKPGVMDVTADLLRVDLGPRKSICFTAPLDFCRIGDELIMTVDQQRKTGT